MSLCVLRAGDDDLNIVNVPSRIRTRNSSGASNSMRDLVRELGSSALFVSLTPRTPLTSCSFYLSVKIAWRYPCYDLALREQ